MPKLNDTQSVLLATAAQRDSGSLYPLAETLTPGARVAQAVSKLTASALVVERKTTEPAATHRIDRDLRLGLFITPAGLQAIGIAPEGGYQLSDNIEPPSPSLPAAASHGTKASQVLTLLSCPGGATLAEMIEKNRVAAALHARRAHRPAQEGPRYRAQQTGQSDLLPHRQGGRGLMNVEAELARLETLSPAELRVRWAEVTGTMAPRVRPKLLRLALAWELQAKVFGGHSRETIHLLDRLERGQTKTSRATPGVRLVREWGGKAHIVTVGDDQVIRWDGKEWRSLSEVARAITGTRWSGPAFFGLRKRMAA